MASTNGKFPTFNDGPIHPNPAGRFIALIECMGKYPFQNHTVEKGLTDLLECGPQDRARLYRGMGDLIDLSGACLGLARAARATNTAISRASLSVFQDANNVLRTMKLDDSWGEMFSRIGPEPVSRMQWLVWFVPGLGDGDQYSEWRKNTLASLQQARENLLKAPGEERDASWLRLLESIDRTIQSLLAMAVAGPHVVQQVMIEIEVAEAVLPSSRSFSSEIRTTFATIRSGAAFTADMLAIYAALTRPELQAPAMVWLLARYGRSSEDTESGDPPMLGEPT